MLLVSQNCDGNNDDDDEYDDDVDLDGSGLVTTETWLCCLGDTSINRDICSCNFWDSPADWDYCSAAPDSNCCVTAPAKNRNWNFVDCQNGVALLRKNMYERKEQLDLLIRSFNILNFKDYKF